MCFIAWPIGCLNGKRDSGTNKEQHGILHTTMQDLDSPGSVSENLVKLFDDYKDYFANSGFILAEKEKMLSLSATPATISFRGAGQATEEASEGWSFGVKPHDVTFYSSSENKLLLERIKDTNSLNRISEVYAKRSSYVIRAWSLASRYVLLNVETIRDAVIDSNASEFLGNIKKWFSPDTGSTTQENPWPSVGKARTKYFWAKTVDSGNLVPYDTQLSVEEVNGISSKIADLRKGILNFEILASSRLALTVEELKKRVGADSDTLRSDTTLDADLRKASTAVQLYLDNRITQLSGPPLTKKEAVKNLEKVQTCKSKWDKLLGDFSTATDVFRKLLGEANSTDMGTSWTEIVQLRTDMVSLPCLDDLNGETPVDRDNTKWETDPPKSDDFQKKLESLSGFSLTVKHLFDDQLALAQEASLDKALNATLKESSKTAAVATKTKFEKCVTQFNTIAAQHDLLRAVNLALGEQQLDEDVSHLEPDSSPEWKDVMDRQGLVEGAVFDMLSSRHDTLQSLILLHNQLGDLQTKVAGILKHTTDSAETENRKKVVTGVHTELISIVKVPFLKKSGIALTTYNIEPYFADPKRKTEFVSVRNKLSETHAQQLAKEHEIQTTEIVTLPAWEQLSSQLQAITSWQIDSARTLANYVDTSAKKKDKSSWGMGLFSVGKNKNTTPSEVDLLIKCILDLMIELQSIILTNIQQMLNGVVFDLVSHLELVNGRAQASQRLYFTIKEVMWRKKYEQRLWNSMHELFDNSKVNGQAELTALVDSSIDTKLSVSTKALETTLSDLQSQIKKIADTNSGNAEGRTRQTPNTIPNPDTPIPPAVRDDKSSTTSTDNDSTTNDQDNDNSGPPYADLHYFRVTAVLIFLCSFDV